MDTEFKQKEFLINVRQGRLSRFEALTKVLQVTENDPDRIHLFIGEILHHYERYKQVLNEYIVKVIEHNRLEKISNEFILFQYEEHEFPMYFFQHHRFTDEVQHDTSSIRNIIHNEDYQSVEDLPKTEDNQIDFEGVFYPRKFSKLLDLLLLLNDRIKPQQPKTQNKEPVYIDTLGNKWNTADRFDLLTALGFNKQLDDSGLSEEDKNEILAIILKTTPEYCRKTKYATTKTNANRTNEIEDFKQKFKTPKK